METGPKTATHYLLKIPDGTVYGPVDVATLCMWAADARVIPGCMLSEDRATWVSVETLPELRLNWTVRFEDGTLYGPMNLLAVWLLASENSIPRGVVLVEKGTNRKLVLDDTLAPLLLDECRLVLAGCGRLIGTVMSAQQGKLSRLEKDLESSMKLVSASQWRLAEAETTAVKLLECTRENERFTTELAALRKELKADYSRREEIEGKIGTLQARVAELESERKLLGQQVDELQAEKSRSAELEAELTPMRQRLAEAEAKVPDLEARLATAEAKVPDLETRLGTEQECVRKLADEATGTKLELKSLTDQLAKAREAAGKAQKAVRAAELKIRDERAAIQHDLNSMMLASRCVKQVAGLIKPKPTPVDWINSPSGDKEEDADDLEARFDRLTLSEKLVVLQKELHMSAEQKNLLRHELENLKGRHEFLQKNSGDREKEAAEKLAKIQKEIKTSSDLLDQALKEIEKREAQLREFRKKGDFQVRDGVEKQAVLEAEVVHLEVLGPEEQGAHPEPVVMERNQERREGSPPKGGFLNNVEAQLQRELKHWDALKREKKSKGGTIGKWFLGKKP